MKKSLRTTVAAIAVITCGLGVGIGEAWAWSTGTLNAYDGSALVGSGSASLSHSANKGNSYATSTKSSHFGSFTVIDKKDDGKSVYGSLKGSHNAIYCRPAFGGRCVPSLQTYSTEKSTAQVNGKSGKKITGDVGFVVTSGMNTQIGITKINTGARICRADNVLWHTCSNNGNYAGFND